VLEDPRLLGLETCELDLAPDSPAREAGPDGTDIGAR